MHPRDMARLGQLFLQRGRWGRGQILSEAWVHAATRAQVARTTSHDHYGYFWWVKGEDFPGMFEAVGRGGQRINVWPAKDLVLVFTGGEFEPDAVGAQVNLPDPQRGAAPARVPGTGVEDRNQLARDEPADRLFHLVQAADGRDAALRRPSVKNWRRCPADPRTAQRAVPTNALTKSVFIWN